MPGFMLAGNGKEIHFKMRHGKLTKSSCISWYQCYGEINNYYKLVIIDKIERVFGMFWEQEYWFIFIG